MVFRIFYTASTNNNQLCRSKTPTAEQLRSPAQDNMRDRLDDMNTGNTNIDLLYFYLLKFKNVPGYMHDKYIL